MPDHIHYKNDCNNKPVTIAELFPKVYFSYAKNECKKDVLIFF